MSAVSKKAPFLAAFKTCASISKAADAAGIDRGLHYRWLREDPEYPAAFRQACAEAAQFLEDQAVERATEGWDEPVIYHGELAMRALRDEAGELVRDAEGEPILVPLTIRRRSDALLQTLLKAWLPQKYRENHKIEHSGPDGGPIPVQPGLANLNDEQLAQLTELARILAQSGGARSGEAQAEPEQTGEVLPG